jgi:hypothetical protein
VRESNTDACATRKGVNHNLHPIAWHRDEWDARPQSIGPGHVTVKGGRVECHIGVPLDRYMLILQVASKQDLGG